MIAGPKKLDLNQLAKRIVVEATGDEPVTSALSEKNKVAQELGRLCGIKGGVARAKSPEPRSDIAKKTAAKRWSK